MPSAVQWLNLSNWPDGVINKEIMACVIIKQRSKKNYFKNILYIFHEQPLNNGCLPPPPHPPLRDGLGSRKGSVAIDWIIWHFSTGWALQIQSLTNENMSPTLSEHLDLLL